MKRLVHAAVLSGLLAAPLPALAAPQDPQVEVPPLQAKDVGYSLGAAALNVLYVPLRLAVTTVTGAVGGVTGFLVGGDPHAAAAIWRSTDGQAFLTPEILDGSEPLRPFVRTDTGPWRATVAPADADADVAPLSDVALDEEGLAPEEPAGAEGF